MAHKTVKVNAGSKPLGPSPDYVKLLRGKISPTEYVDKVKREADLPSPATRKAAAG